MYTSYSGIRSTEPGGPSAERFDGCVLAATPSLGALMELLVGIEVEKLAAGALLREPGVEARRDQTVGALLPVGGAHGQHVRVFILDVLVVAAHPAPVHGVHGGDLRQLLPQVRVLERARLAAPATGCPATHPLVHAFDEILRVRHEAHVGMAPLAPHPFERSDRARERHLVVRGLRRALVKVPARHAVPGRRLDQRRVAPPARLRRVVAETTLVPMNQHEASGHGWITTGISVCSKISSAWETVTALRRPSPETCAPAKSASHSVSWITRATASPGVPCSRCVTNATPCNESSASASPTTMVPTAGSMVA